MKFLISIVVLDWIIRISLVANLFTAILLFIRWKVLRPEYRWFSGILVCRFFTILVSELFYLNHINPNYGGSVYYIIVIIFFAGFFVHASAFSKKNKTILYGVAGAHMIFSLANLLFIQKETINSYSSISLAIIIVTLCLVFYYKLLKDLPTQDLLTWPSFWLVTAEFIVISGQVLMESFTHLLINIFNDNLIILWVFHHGLGHVGQIIALYAVWLIYKNSKSMAFQ